MVKIKSEELTRLVDLGSDDPISVLIELDDPAQTRIEVERSGGKDGAFRVRRVVPDASEPEHTQSIKEVRQVLEEISETSPRWLESSQIFVARITPRNLRVIADLPYVKAIWPNRELRTSA
jgi:hypothetical protein